MITPAGRQARTLPLAAFVRRCAELMNGRVCLLHALSKLCARFERGSGHYDIINEGLEICIHCKGPSCTDDKLNKIGETGAATLIDYERKLGLQSLHDTLIENK